MLRLTPTEAHATSLIATKWPGMTIELERELAPEQEYDDVVPFGALAVRCVSKSTTWEYTGGQRRPHHDRRGAHADSYAELMENRLMEAIYNRDHGDEVAPPADPRGVPLLEGVCPPLRAPTADPPRGLRRGARCLRRVRGPRGRRIEADVDEVVEALMQLGEHRYRRLTEDHFEIEAPA